MFPSVFACGDQAIAFQLGDRIDADVNARIIAMADTVEAADLRGVTELVPTYRSLLVRYDPEIIRGAELERQLLALFDMVQPKVAPSRLLTVPVVYGGTVGQDLDDLAGAKGLTPDEVIALHSAAEYRVYMIGFAPGFAYLGGLPKALHMPRLAHPRQLIPAGAIGIGGQQASINSVAGPSGWRYVGWTPARAFDPDRTEPFLLRAGDRVRFRPVSPEEGQYLENLVAAGISITGDVA